MRDTKDPKFVRTLATIIGDLSVSGKLVYFSKNILFRYKKPFTPKLKYKISFHPFPGGEGNTCEFNNNVFESKCSILKRFINQGPDGKDQLALQKQALYAMQHLVHELEHPPSEFIKRVSS